MPKEGIETSSQRAIMAYLPFTWLVDLRSDAIGLGDRPLGVKEGYTKCMFWATGLAIDDVRLLASQKNRCIRGCCWFVFEVDRYRVHFAMSV